MIRAFIRRGDGAISTDASPDAVRAALADPAATFWVDLTDPADADYAILTDVFQFHPLAVEDVTGHVQRPKLERYPADAAGHPYFYLVVHSPDVESFRSRLRTDEIDIFLGDRYLVTIHDNLVKSLDSILVRAERQPGEVLALGIDVILHQILDRMADLYEPILDQLQERLDALEDRAAECPEPALLPQLSAVKRDLLTLRRIIGPQRDVLAMLTRGEVPFVRESTRIYLRDVLDHLSRAVETIELYRDMVLGARDIYMSSISNNLNQIMKTLTVISVIALPMTIVTSFFGMNFEAMPGLHSRAGFWIAVTAMAALVAGLLAWFRHRRWL